MARAGGKTAAATFANLKTSVEELLPLIEAEADTAEKQYKLTDRVVAELRKAGLYSMLLPAELGGSELPFVDAMAIIERLSWADAATGWCTMVSAVTCASSAVQLTNEGVETLYGKGPDVLICGNGVPRGQAQPVAGGYMFKGSWGYGSGISHADWVQSGCMVMDNGRPKLGPHGVPEFILAHHPRDTVELRGNWDVIGLRGTGSYDYVLKDGEIFVPDFLCVPVEHPKIYRGGAQYSIGLPGAAAWAHCSWGLGVGRRALDEIKRYANERGDVFGLLGDSITFRKSFAEAEVKYRSVRAFAYESWNSLAETFARGDQASIEQIAMIRMAVRHAHDVLSEVVSFAHRTSRGHSLRASKLQRVFRDANAGTQHFVLADEMMVECGRVLLGRFDRAKASWNMLGVQDK